MERLFLKQWKKKTYTSMLTNKISFPNSSKSQKKKKRSLFFCRTNMETAHWNHTSQLYRKRRSRERSKNKFQIDLLKKVKAQLDQYYPFTNTTRFTSQTLRQNIKGSLVTALRNITQLSRWGTPVSSVFCWLQGESLEAIETLNLKSKLLLRSSSSFCFFIFDLIIIS